MRFLSDLAGTMLSFFRIRPAGSTGAPVSGAYGLGTLYCDSAGVLWRCTAAGTPGVWERLNKAQIAAVTSDPPSPAVGDIWLRTDL